MQTNNSSNTSNRVKPDKFRVGDTVWCVVNGKGVVVETYPNHDYEDTYPIGVSFDDSQPLWYTADGKYSYEGNRTLFFSEPKIEASVTRPFVPTLVGKRVVVKSFSFLTEGIIHSEDSKSFMLESGTSFQKEDVTAIYEISSENLLKP